MNRVGRNDPCPCGSGKKYKQCCGSLGEAQAGMAHKGYTPPPISFQEALEHHKAGRLMQAEAIYRQILQREPNYPEALHFLGVIAYQTGKNDFAVELISKAIDISASSQMYSNLGAVYQALHKSDKAAESYRKALALKPDFADAYHNLGIALQDQGKLDEAVESFRKALALKPDYTDAYSKLLFSLNYHPDLSAEDIYKVYQEYDARHGIPLRSTWRAHDNDRDPNRRLRIGYVSPDFRLHSGNPVLEPLLAHHDKAQVEIYAYAELAKEDCMTARFQSHVERWIPTKGMSDEALAERIRSDRIDILVDLAGHTAGNRLLVFARKPAPVSLSWLGYGYTTGLSAIDYYLTDETSAPAGSEGLFAEHLWRMDALPSTCRPVAGMGEANSLPAQQRGYITFGTLSRSVRINHRTIRVWAEILKAVPNSRLIVDSLNFKDPEMQERLTARFAEHGITRDRLEIGYHSPPWDILRSMDISLDCFPHNSGTTLFESLYMGVPYITLAGRPSVGRLGGSLLQSVGHPEWIAGSEDDYVSSAVDLAGDIARLSEIRSTLRDQVESSPIRDEEGFARKVEDAYRRMWQFWCETGGRK